jgi:UDPglucose--hexose-1-phosphate uridylyltransferase
MDGERCEVVLYTPIHEATLWSLGPAGVAGVVDLWAERTRALGDRDDVEFVLAFENRGAEVGATITHPHGQIYAYDHVPDRPRRRLEAGWHPDHDPADRLVAPHGDWRAWIPSAPTFPVEVALAPATRVPDLPSLDGTGRIELAEILVDVLERLDRLYDRPLPYMMWLNQRPTIVDGFEDAWLNVEVVSPWRATGVPRFIAAAEVACEEYFNPVVPEDLAGRLRALERR